MVRESVIGKLQHIVYSMTYIKRLEKYGSAIKNIDMYTTLRV